MKGTNHNRLFERRQQFQAKKLNLGGDIKGDGFQNGGALVVEKGGSKTLMQYVQQAAPDHVSNEEVLKVSRIEKIQTSVGAETSIISGTRDLVGLRPTRRGHPDTIRLRRPTFSLAFFFFFTVNLDEMTSIVHISTWSAIVTEKYREKTE